MTFNKEQEYFYNFIINFTKKINHKTNEDYENNMILLNAPAGTGKTFVIKQIAHYFKINKYNNIEILAPTNKAVSILETEIFNVKTIHKFFKSTREVDNDGNIEYIFEDINIKNCLIIVDEASMINNKMFESFIKLAKFNIILFVGDDLQLLPINDNENTELSTKSKCFSITSHTFKFTKNMRSKLFTSTLMLENARKACYKLSMPSEINSLYVNEIIDIFKKNKNTNKSCIILAFTNAAVNNYNNIIRSELFDKKFDELNKYYIGERLIYTGACIKNDKKYVTSDEIVIEDLIIITEEILFKTCNCIEFKRSRCKLHDLRKDSIILNFYKITDQYKNTWYKPVNDKQFYILSYQFKKVCQIYKKKELWYEYYNFIDKWNADLKYNYSMTIHKSQGSQFNIVFVDRSNIISCCSKNIVLKVNCYYTAISRMIDEVYDIKKNI